MRPTQEADAQGSAGSSAAADSSGGRSPARRYLIWALIVVLALVPFVFIEGPGAGWLRDLGLVDRDERFTELYFPDRRALPTTSSVGAPIAFEIALHNLEGEATSYRWKAVVTTDGRDVDLARGRVRLDDGEVRRIPVSGATPGPPGLAVVQVALVGRDEAIDFRVEVAEFGSPPG